MEKAAATNLVLLSEKGQKRGLETRALNTIFTPCSRRTNCWLRLFYHGSLSFWWWNDWEKPFRIEIDLENEFERTICSISKNPFQQIVHFNTCNSILVFMKCCINVKFFWKTNFNLEAILPCNKPTPLYLPCLVVEDEGTSSISIVNWGSHSSLLQWYNIQRGGLESDPPFQNRDQKGRALNRHHWRTDKTWKEASPTIEKK